MITRYEIAARHPDGRAILIAYSPRLSRSGLLDAMRAQADAILARLDGFADAAVRFATKPRPHCTAGAWWVGFTGRTQLDARSGGELPFVAEAGLTVEIHASVEARNRIEGVA